MLTQVRYSEHDIYPFVNKSERGLERIVTGNDGTIYYTADHYITFIRLR